jgi:hypothetical protein
MPTERDTLQHLVEDMSEDEVRALLALVRQRTAEPAPRRPSWIGMLHEGPDFAKNAKDTLRAELGEHHDSR